MFREKKYVFFSERAARLFGAFCALVLLFSVLMPLKGAAEIYSSVLRFHVVANSDSEADQSLKLAVRDKLLDWTGEGLARCSSRAEAAVFLSAQKEELMRRVRAFLADQGAGYGAEAEILEEYHAAKTYEDITLPQGSYLSFRVTLGAGEGQNFFCVLFPPICRSSAQKTASEVLVEYGLDEGGVRFFSEKSGVQVRFFLWDRIREVFHL